MPSIQVLLKWLQDPRTLDESFCDAVRNTWKVFVVMARHPDFGSCFQMPDPKDRLKLKTLKVAPAEFIASAILIHQHRAKLTLRQLAEAIRDMRRTVREIETDIRMNSRVFRPMLAYIKDLKASHLMPDRSKPAAVAVNTIYKQKVSTKKEEDAMDVDVSLPAPSGPPSPKKKRVRRDSDDDSDYVETRKPIVSATKTATRAKKAKSPPPGLPPPPPSLPPPPVSAPPPQSSYAAPQSSSQYSNPPPYSASFNTGSQLHPDRLAAIRTARVPDSSQPPRGPRNDPRMPPNNLQPDRGWSTLPPRPSSGQAPYHQDSLSQSLMSRMNMAFSTPGPPSRPGFSPTNEHPPYDPRLSTNMPYGRRDGYTRTTNNSSWR